MSKTKTAKNKEMFVILDKYDDGSGAESRDCHLYSTLAEAEIEVKSFLSENPSDVVYIAKVLCECSLQTQVVKKELASAS
jgi:hypothetical protein